MMFPTQMPPVDRLIGGKDSAGKRYGYTTYDEDDIPRTELWRHEIGKKQILDFAKGLMIEQSLLNTPILQEES